AVAEHLHLDVPRREDVFFDEYAVVAERAGALALGAVERVLELTGFVDAAHPLATAARDRLDQHRIADRAGFLLEALGVLILAEVARSDRHASLGHQFLRCVLETHG